MRVGHMSDLHGSLSLLWNTSEIPDLWIATGDIFPNQTLQRESQTLWIRPRIDRLIYRLGGKPVVWVAGNHDYICLVEEIKARVPDYPAYEVTPDGFELLGLKFAGFREINYIQGEWIGEVTEQVMEKLARRTFKSDPDILVTHAPPAGILCDKGWTQCLFGVASLNRLLTYSPHRVRAHFFGHAHSGSGETEEMGIRFFNGSSAVRFHDL